VRRSHLLAILAAWIITVPVTALLSAGLFKVLARIGGAG
jgi:phosphate/sulfate permease